MTFCVKLGSNWPGFAFLIHRIITELVLVKKRRALGLQGHLQKGGSSFQSHRALCFYTLVSAAEQTILSSSEHWLIQPSRILSKGLGCCHSPSHQSVRFLTVMAFRQRLSQECTVCWCNTKHQKDHFMIWQFYNFSIWMKDNSSLSAALESAVKYFF